MTVSVLSIVRRRYIVPLAVAALSSLAQAGSLSDPSGTWLVHDERARIRIEKCGPQKKNLCGYVVWLRDPLDDDGKPRVDSKNPDPKKVERPILGHEMILGLKLNGDEHYEGKVYNSEEGGMADVTIWSEQPKELLVHGCMLRILCGSQTWKRVNDVAPGQLTAPTDAPGGPRSDRN